MSSANADVELLTEHFGYPPVSLLDDIINSVNIYAERALNSVEQALLRLPPTSLGFNPASFQTKAAGADKLSHEALEAAAEQAHHHEVENGTHQLETLLCASIDRNFDKFEIYAMRNILCVKPEDRDWLRLAHYEGLEFATDAAAEGGADKAEDDTDASIAHLHRRLQASLKLGHLLDIAGQRNEAMLKSLRSVAIAIPQEPPSASSLAFLLNRGPLTESDAASPLTTTTAFALSQLPSLRQLSGDLRQKAPGLAAAAAADNDDAHVGDSEGAAEGGRASSSRNKTWRRERVEYVESSTRKHLERVRGLSLGRNGETRSEIEGSAQGAGGSRTPGGSAAMSVEPEALKNILNILRDTHGSKPAAAEADASQQDDEAMDES